MIGYVARLVILFCISFPGYLLADEAQEAQAASKKIMTLLSNGDYRTVWNSHMSNVFKSSVTKDSFIANLTLGRQPLGSFVKGKQLDRAYSDGDPGTGYKGSVYAFNYLNEYSQQKLYERVVLINEDGSGFKLAGFWANIAQ